MSPMPPTMTASTASSSEPDRIARKPDGVAVDPAMEVPPAEESGASDERLIALRTPLGADVPRRLLAGFFRAVVEEDLGALSELLMPDATAAIPPRGGGVTATGGGSAIGALDHWRARLRRGQYRKLATEMVYQDPDVETYRYDDLTLSAGATERPPRPASMDRTDLLLRVPILTTRVGSDRVFGDEMRFVLRRDGPRLLIRQILEEFQMP